MQDTGFQSMSLAASALAWLATLAATAALGVAGAYWTWAWFAPRPEPATDAPMAAARLDAAYQLFGNVRANRLVAAPSSVTFKLLGLAAASGEEPGYAVLQMSSGRAIAVRRGDDIEPGIRLAEVKADHVVIDRQGMRETLALPRQRLDAATGAGDAR